MAEFLITHEASIRLGMFAGVLLVMVVLETLLPRKQRVLPRLKRWTTNALIVVVDTVVLRLIMPVLAVGVAVWAASKGYGIFNLTGLSLWLEIMLGVILLDLAVYAQHVAFHRIPVLWALHKVHHADRDIDVTTALRFHPVEIILSMVYKLCVVVLLGPSVVAVILFEVLLNGCAMFNHANIRLPLTVDRFLRPVLVTPDMHRVHHSVYRAEQDNNYGFCLSLWDRLFRTYTAQPCDGHDGMVIGLEDYQDDRPALIGWSLYAPFASERTQKKDMAG